VSRKHNTKHNRSRSRYSLRLKKRGATGKTVRMLSLYTLRRRAGMSESEAREGLSSYTG